VGGHKERGLMPGRGKQGQASVVFPHHLNSEIFDLVFDFATLQHYFDLTLAKLFRVSPAYSSMRMSLVFGNFEEVSRV